MKRILFTAMHSGAGKTVAVCGFLAAMKQRGTDVRAFKCGPDYIDPMFHARVLGVPSRNLDLFLQGEEKVRESLARNGGALAVLEGAMGYYDGEAGTDRASAWQVARATRTPAILIVRPKGVGLTLAAQIKGVIGFREESGIAGILLTDCKSSLHSYLKPLLEKETGLPVVGYLPPMEEAKLESRHLGLLTAGEVEDFAERFRAIAAQMEETVDLDRILELAAEDPLPVPEEAPKPRRCRIGVAKDEAFCFYYADSLDALTRAGAELCYFSPTRDEALPEGLSGLYLGGGYPELYAKELSENVPMRRAVRAAIEAGVPTLAECGGFLYLHEELEDPEGKAYPAVGAVAGRGFGTKSLKRFGYAKLCPEADSMLFRAGEEIPVHEFHYWDCTENGDDLLVKKSSGRSWRCGLTGPAIYTAFPHLHLDGEAPLAERFVSACENFEKERGK